MDFPGGSVDKKTTCQCRGHGFNLWSGKIPPAAGQLGPCTTTTQPTCSRACELKPLKPARLEPVLHNERSHRDGKPMHCNEE